MWIFNDINNDHASHDFLHILIVDEEFTQQKLGLDIIVETVGDGIGIVPIDVPPLWTIYSSFETEYYCLSLVCH